MAEKDLRQALDALQPSTKAAQLRAYLPLIETKLAAGVRLADIVLVLASGGLQLTEATLKSYLQRHRKKAAANKRASGGGAAAPKAASASAAGAFLGETHAPVSVAGDVRARPPSAAAVGSAAVALDELVRVMQPDPSAQAERLSQYETLAKRHRKGTPV